MSRKTHFQFQRVSYIIILLAASFFIVSPFIIPIILAGTMALALYPLQLKLEQRKWKPSRAAVCITTGFTFLISMPFMFFMTKGSMLVIEQLEKFTINQKIQDQGIQQVVRSLRKDIIRGSHEFISNLPFASSLTEAKLDQYLLSANAYLLSFFKNLALSLPTMMLFLIVMILSVYAFLSGAHGVRQFFQEIFGFTNRKMDQFIGIFLRDAREVYVSNIATGAIQSLIVATGVYFINDLDWFMIFFVTLIFSFVPVIGAAPMALLFALVSFFQGNNTGAFILVGLGLFTGLIDNILRPWLASFGNSKAPGVVNFIFVIGGALLLGFPGLFIGLLVGAIVYDTLPLFWEEIDKTEGANGSRISEIFSFGDKSKDQDQESKH